MTVFETLKQHKKSAAEGGRLLRLLLRLLYSRFLGVENKYTHIEYSVYLMEHICFEVQLCSEILISNEKSNFWYTDHPEKPALILQSELFRMMVDGSGQVWRINGLGICCHLDIQFDFLATQLSVFLRSLTPYESHFYFKTAILHRIVYKSSWHSGLAWGAILE